METDFVVSVDVGTSNTRILVSEVFEGGEIKIIGVVSKPTAGVAKGRVVDRDSLSGVVGEAKLEAEKMSGVEIEGACLSVSNADIKSFDSQGVLTVQGDMRITDAEIGHVTRNARKVPLPSDRLVLHMVGQHFTVDGEADIENPIGRRASRLEKNLHIVTTLKKHDEAVKNVMKSNGIDVVDQAFCPFAASCIAMRPGQKEEGALLIDIGSEVTSYALYCEGVVRSSGVFPVGGFNVSNDISIGLGMPLESAEDMKIKFGAGIPDDDSPGEYRNARTFSKGDSCRINPRKIREVVEPRVEELFLLIREDVRHDPYFALLQGKIVLSGGGSRLKGIDEIAQKVFGMGVVHGVPEGFTGLSEMLSDESWNTAAGLLVVGKEKLGMCRESSPGGCFEWVRQGLKRVVKTF